MREHPSAIELIRSVRQFLSERALPELQGRTAFHARVAANALEIVERELALAPATEQAELERLRAILTVGGGFESAGGATSYQPGATPRVGGAMPGATPRVGGAMPGATPRVGGAMPGATPRVGGAMPGATPRVRGALPGATPRVGGAMPGATPRVDGLDMTGGDVVEPEALPGAEGAACVSPVLLVTDTRHNLTLETATGSADPNQPGALPRADMRRASGPRVDDVAALNRELCRRIRDGSIGPDTPGLIEHLWETTLAQLAVDQPGYASYKRAIAEREGKGKP